MRSLRGTLNAGACALVVVIVAVWEVAFRSGVIRVSGIPRPAEIARALWELTASGEMTGPLLHTFTTVVLASACALALGLLLGTALGISPLVSRWAMASVDFLRSIPVVALVPVVVLFWGPSTKSEFVITTYAALWVMTVNTVGGFRTVHPRLNDISRMFELSRVRQVRSIWLPAVMPSVLVGARLVVVVATINAVIAESFVNPAGLGWELVRAQQGLRPADLWAYAVIAGLFGYVLNRILIVTVRLLYPSGRANPGLIGV